MRRSGFRYTLNAYRMCLFIHKASSIPMVLTHLAVEGAEMTCAGG